MSKDYKSHILATTTQAAELMVNNNRGFIRTAVSDLTIDSNDIWVGPRNILEHDSNYKHIIPYIVIKQDGKYLTYMRTSSGGESRLHGNMSIGFGGHIDVGDIVTKNKNQQIDFIATIINSAKRELEEELSLMADNIKLLGLLYDDSNSVGMVHIGIALLVEVDCDLIIKSPEDQINLVGFEFVSDIRENSGAYENWSALLLDGDI